MGSDHELFAAIIFSIKVDFLKNMQPNASKFEADKDCDTLTTDSDKKQCKKDLWSADKNVYAALTTAGPRLKTDNERPSAYDLFLIMKENLPEYNEFEEIIIQKYSQLPCEITTKYFSTDKNLLKFQALEASKFQSTSHQSTVWKHCTGRDAAKIKEHTCNNSKLEKENDNCFEVITCSLSNQEGYEDQEVKYAKDEKPRFTSATCKEGYKGKDPKFICNNAGVASFEGCKAIPQA